MKNNITDISPLENLTNLERLRIYEEKIDDITPLVKNQGLGEGDHIYLPAPGHNKELDFTEGSQDMKNIKLLQERGVEVSY